MQEEQTSRHGPDQHLLPDDDGNCRRGSSAFSVTTQLRAEGSGCVPLFNPSEGNVFLRPSSRLKSEEKSDHKLLYFPIPRAPPTDSPLPGPSQLGIEAVEGPSQDRLS